MFVASSNTNSLGVINIGEYNATTGATINANFISNLASGGLSNPLLAILIDSGHLFAATYTNSTIAEFNATTGMLLTSNFISSSQTLQGPLALATDGNNHLFVVNGISDSVGVYDATTGATINSSLISASQGLSEPDAIIFVPASVPRAYASNSNEPSH